MTLESFIQAPWKTSHEVYKDSALAISPAPKYASSEVLVASLYRAIGFNDASEGSVPQFGRDLDKSIQKNREKNKKPTCATVNAEIWNIMLHGVLESPKAPNQSSKRFLQVTPLVPETALFSGSARLSNNSWPAGRLIRRMVWLGSDNAASARTLWEELFNALDIKDNDDVFARWLQQEIKAWAEDRPVWQLIFPSEKDVAVLNPEDLQQVHFPARQFTKDLRAIILAKNSMTRRQWISLLESVLRLAAVAHVIWLCDVQARLWTCIEASISGAGPLNEEQARAEVFPNNLSYMNYGDKALPGIKDQTSKYLRSRLGLNAVLWSLDDCNVPFKGQMSSSSDIAALCAHIRINKDALASKGIQDTILEINEQEARALLCKKGIGSNITEFVTHLLGQRQTASDLLRGYDQGYVIKKKKKRSPWLVSLGPVSVISMVHCALAGMGGPRSIHRLSLHLAAYGIIINRHDIAQNDLGHQLRMLGLVLDSPDAESGMLLLPPFPANSLAVRAITR